MTPPVFAHGHLRLYLLALLNEQPRHGYELIQALSDRFGGTYAPSAGTIYPRLAKLEEEGLVTKEADGRKTVYRITEAGRREVADRADELTQIEEGVDSSAQRLAHELRENLTTARDRLRTEFDGLRARSAGPDGPNWGSDFGQKASDFVQRATTAATAGWSAAEAHRASGADLGGSATAGFKAAKAGFTGDAVEPDAPAESGERAGSADRGGSASRGAGTHAEAAGDSNVARRADLSLDRFRQELKQDLRQAEARGRVDEGVVGLIEAELHRVRDLVRHALAPRE